MTNLVKHVRDKHGLLVGEHQHHSNSVMKTSGKCEYQLFPTQSTPAFNSFFTINITPQQKILENLTLYLNTSAVSGITTSASDHYVLPAAFWVQRMEVCISSKVISTITGEIFWYLHQLFSLSEEDRTFANTQMGDYSSVTKLNALTTASSEWFLDLYSIFKQSHIHILNNNFNVELRIYMRSLSDVYVAGSGSGTPSMIINSAYAIAKVCEMSPQEASNYTQQLAKLPRHILYRDVNYQIISQSSGVSSGNYTLTAFSGQKVETIVFVIRPSGATGSNLLTYTAPTSWDITDSGGQSMTGGTVITSSRALKYLSRQFTNTNFQIGGSSVNNVYVWSFSHNPLHSIQTGVDNGYEKWTGAEQLKITYSSSLSSAVEIFVFSVNLAAIQITPLTIEKINI